jgi:hypothetical protein
MDQCRRHLLWGLGLFANPDAMTERGIDVTLADRRLSLSRESNYAADDFKFNPYGIIRIDA